MQVVLFQRGDDMDINNAIQTLRIVHDCWADQVPNDREKISDADAIKQSIRCLEEYLESSERVRNASITEK